MSEHIKMTLNSPYQSIQFWNGVFNLTKTELQVLSLLIAVSNDNESDHLCTPSNKKAVAMAMGIKDHNTLNNYIKRLKDKEAIQVDSDKRYTLHKLLKADDGGETTVTVYRRY